METGVVIIQEPVFTKTSVEEAPAGVTLDHSSMEVDKVNLSTVLDDEITSHNIISGEADVAEVVNGSGNKEAEGSEREKGEAIKTISVVEDSKIVKEKTSETEKDEQGHIFVHEPERFNKNTDDSEIVLSDVTLEKEIEDDLTRKPDEVSDEKPIIEEDQTATKHSPEQEEKIGTISKVLIDTAPFKVDEDNIEKSLKTIPIKTDELKDSRTAETSVNGIEAEHNATVSVEEISRNSENILNETAPEEETATHGELVHDVEVTKRVLLEAEKEEEKEEVKTEAESTVNAKEKEEKETVKIVSNEETTSHESESLKGDDHQRETAEPVETIKHSEDAEQISRELAVQESLTVIKTPTKQGEDDEENEHVLVRDIPQGETLVTQAETVDTSTVQEPAILKTLETKTDETDIEPSLDLNDDKEQEEAETVKTVISSSDEVQESITVIKPPETSPELKEEEDQSSKDTEGYEHVLGRNMPQGEIFVTEAETLETKEDTEQIMDLKEDKEHEETEKLEQTPSDLALKVDKAELKDDKIKVYQFDGAQTMEKQRGLDVNESEAEQIDRTRTNETEESPIEKLVVHPAVESVEQIEKPYLESPSELSEETSKTVDEKIEEKLEEDVTLHQEDQEDGFYGFETKGSVLGEKLVLEEKSVTDLTPLQEESCLRNEQENETKVEKEKIEKHEPTNEEVSNDQQSLLEENSDEVIQVSSATPSEEREGETVVETEKIEDIKANEEEQVGDKIQKSVETVKTVDVEPVNFNEDDIEESLNSTREHIQTKSMDKENVPIDETDDVNEQNTVNEIALEDDHHGEHAERVEAIKNSDGAEKSSHEVTGDREKEEDKTKEVQESPTIISIQGENIESKASKDTEEHEHVLVRDMPQIETLVTEAEAVNTSTVQEAAILKSLETTINETEACQETKDDTEPNLDVKEDKEKQETETVRPSDQVDAQAEELGEGREESIEVKSEETVQDEITDEKHENLLDVPYGESEKFQVNEPETVLVATAESRDKFEDISSDLVLKVDKEEVKDDETKVNKVDGTQQRGLDLNETEAGKIDRNRTDEIEESQVEKLVSLPDVESVEKMQKPSPESPSKVSEETSTTVDEKIEEKPQGEELTQLHQESQEEASYGLETKEETTSVAESSDIGVKAQEEESCLPKETELQKEKTEKHEPINEVPNDQQSLVEEKSDEVVQVSSALPSEEHEGGIVVGAEKIEDIKANEEEQVADKIQKSLETIEIAEPHSSLPLYSEEQEHEAVSEKIEDENVKEQEPIVQTLSEISHERQEEFSKTGDTTVVQEEQTRDIVPSLTGKCSMDQTHAEEQVKDEQENVTSTTNESEDDKLDEHVDSPTSLMFSEKSDNETLTAEVTKGDEETTMRDTQQGETIVSQAEAVDASTVQEAAILKTLETTTNESEAVHTPIGGEEESQVTEEDTEPSLDLNEDKEQEETETVKTVILSDEVRSSDVQEEEFSGHTEHCRSEIKDESQGREESVEIKPKEIVQEEEVPLHQEDQKEGSNILETKEETDLVLESSELMEKSQKERNVADLTPLQDESCLPNEQEKETKLQIEETEKHEPTNEEVTNVQQTLVEEKSDEVVQDSSASASEEREGETVAGAIKIEEIKANEEEQSADIIQKSLETVDTTEPHNSLPSSLEKQEHGTVAEAEKIVVENVKDAISEKSLEIAETTDLSVPLEASNLVSEFEEQKPKQVREFLEGDISQKTEEVQESNNTVIKRSTIDGEEIEYKASLDHEDEIDNISKDTEEHEHVLVKDIPQVETLVPQAETVDTSTVQESAILKTLETKEDTKTSLDLKEDKEQEEAETVKTVISSDEAEDFCERTRPCISEIKDENLRTEEFVEVKSKEILQDESSEKHVNLLDEQSRQSDKHHEKEPETVVVGDETTHDQSFLDLESVEKIQKPSLESPSAKSEETCKTVDENIKEKTEKVTHHQKGQEEGSYGLETKEETVAVPESSEIGVKSLEEESRVPNEQENKTSFQKEQIEKHEATNEDLIEHKSHVEEKSDDVIEVLSASHSEEPEGGIDVEAENFEDIKANEEKQVADKIQKIPETVETVDTEPVKFNEDDIEESLNSNLEEIQIKSRDEENVPIDETDEVNTEKYSETAETSANGTEAEHIATVPVEEISRNIVNETAPEDDRQGEKAEPVVAIRNSDDAEKISDEVSGDREKEEAITRKTNEVQETPKVIETPTIQGEDIESKASKDTEQHEHVLVRDMPQVETLLTETEYVDTSKVQESAFSKTLETKVDETEAVHSAIVGEEETEPSLYKKADKEQEEIETIKTVISSAEVRSYDVKAEEFRELTEPCSSEIKDENHGREESVEVKTSETVQKEGNKKNKSLLDAKTKVDQVDGTQTMEEHRGQDLKDPEADQTDQSRTNETEERPIVEAEETTHDQALLDVISVEKMEKPFLESPSAVSEETSKNVDEKIEEKPEEEVTLHQEGQEEGSGGLETKEETISEPQSTELREKSQEEESCPSNEQERETKLHNEQIQKHESTSEEDTNAHQTPVEEKPDEVIQVSSASPSEGREGETVVKAEKIEDIKPKQVKEILEGERKEVDETKAERLPSSENIPQDALSDVVRLQIKRENDATESHERQEDLSKAVETKETTVAQEEHTSDIGTFLTEKCSMDQTQQEEQINEECSRDEKEEVSSTEKGETKTKKPDDENLEKHVDSSEKNDDEILIAKISENVCIKQEEFENLEAPKQEDSKEDKSQEIVETIEAIEATSDHTLAIEAPEAYQTPSFVSELEAQIPKQIEEIHEEERNEAQDLQVVVDRSLPVETSQEDQTPTLVSEHDDQTSKKFDEIHDEETKAHKLQEEENLPTEIVPRESFSEDPVSMLACGEDDQVTVLEGDCAGDKQDERHVSAETKPKESEVERTENSDDQIETSTKVTKVEDEDTKYTDIEVPQSPENACLKQEESKELGDETSSTLPVVEILKELQNTVENEREINDSASLGENKIIEPTDEKLQKTGDADAESSVNDLHSFKEEPETLEKNLVTDMSAPVTNEKHENKVPEESPAFEIIEASMLQQDESGETEKIQEEDILAGKSLPVEELKLQEEHKEEEKVQDGKSRAFEVIVEEKLKEETKEIAECKEETPADLVVTSEKQITEPPSEAEKESNEEHVESQAISNDTKSNNERDFPIEQTPKDQKEEVNADKSLTKEALDEQLQVPSPAERKPSELIQPHQSPNQVEETSFEVKKAQEDKNEESVDALITSENVQVQDQSNDFEHEKKSSDLTYIQEDNGTNVKLEVRDDELRGDGHDSAVSGKEATCLTEVDYVNTEHEDAIKYGVSAEEKNNSYEKTDREATKDIYQEKSKLTDNVTAIKEEIREDEKETTQECFNGMRNTDDATEKTKLEIREIENLSSVSDTQDKSSKQKDEVPNQRKDDDVPKLENLKSAEEFQQKDGESELRVASPELTIVQEPARKSLSDLIQKVKGTDKIEDKTTKPHIEEDPKTEEEDEDEDEHKDDKTSPDSIVMVEAKDTVSITKTHHKKSQGILSGVGSKVKHSISKVKKALTGKSSHTTKQSL